MGASATCRIGHSEVRTNAVCDSVKHVCEAVFHFPACMQRCVPHASQNGQASMYPGPWPAAVGLQSSRTWSCIPGEHGQAVPVGCIEGARCLTGLYC